MFLALQLVDLTLESRLVFIPGEEVAMEEIKAQYETNLFGDSHAPFFIPCSVR